MRVFSNPPIQPSFSPPTICYTKPFFPSPHQPASATRLAAADAVAAAVVGTTRGAFALDEGKRVSG